MVGPFAADAINHAEKETLEKQNETKQKKQQT
jgi:hypothetical protein